MSTEVSPGRRLALGVKRAFDVISCTAVAAALWPLFPALALLVKATSRGPVLFVQERAGLGMRPFKLYKFRTMRVPPPGHDPTRWSPAEEERITPVGRFLRDYGLDELPQVLNILRGDMSVIGPRPPLPAQAVRYEPWKRRMFDMRPGVLSLAGIRGRRSIPMEDRIRYHVEYVERWSLALDLEILWRSLFVVLSRSDAAETDTGPAAARGDSA